MLCITFMLCVTCLVNKLLQYNRYNLCKSSFNAPHCVKIVRSEKEFFSELDME